MSPKTIRRASIILGIIAVAIVAWLFLLSMFVLAGKDISP